MKKELMENKSGVTLIALVITIVVLLILVGISIMAITGENGLINQTMRAKEAADLSDIKEEVMQEWYNLQNETLNEYLSNEKKAERLTERLHAEDPDATVEYKEENETFEVKYKGYTLEIGTDGRVTNNREVAKKNVREAWNKIKDDSNLTEEQKLQKLADELGISREKVTQDENGKIKVEDYNGYTETITTDENGNTNTETEDTPTYTDRASVDITDEPDNLGLYVGSRATFSVTATVTGESSYQWYKTNRESTIGGTPIGSNNSNGANTNTLTIDSVSLEDDAYYYCEITSKYKGRTAKEKTIAVKLTVIQKITEVEISARQVTINEGSTLNIGVTVEGNGTITYQWYKTDTNTNTGGTAIEGATGATLEKSNITAIDTGYYYCIVTQDSEIETNIVTSAPIKVDVKIPVVIDVQPSASQTTVGENIELSVQARGNGTLSYQWYKNSIESNEGGQLIEGATNSTYTKEDVRVADDGYYYCEIRQVFEPDNTDTTIKTNAVRITVNRANITPIVSMQGYTYGGEKTTPTVNGNTENGEVTYYYSTTNSNENGTEWSTVIDSTSLNAGTYYMYAQVAQTTNYNESTTPTVEFTINAKNINAGDMTIELSQASYTYNGNEQTPTTTVTDTTRTETLSSIDYDLSYNNSTTNDDNRTLAGTITITATGKGNYTGTISTTYTINKADVTFNDIPNEIQYVGTNMSKSFTATASTAGTWAVTSGDANVSITEGASVSDSTTDEVEYTGVLADANETPITVAFTPTDTTNYNTPQNQTFTVKATECTADPTELTLYVGGEDGTVTLGGTNHGEFTIAQNDIFSQSYESTELDAEIIGNTLTVTAKTVTASTVELTIKEDNGNKTTTISIYIGTPYTVSYFGSIIMDKYSGDPNSLTSISNNGTVTIDCDDGRCSCCYRLYDVFSN